MIISVSLLNKFYGNSWLRFMVAMGCTRDGKERAHWWQFRSSGSAVILDGLGLPSLCLLQLSSHVNLRWYFVSKNFNLHQCLTNFKNVWRVQLQIEPARWNSLYNNETKQFLTSLAFTLLQVQGYWITCILGWTFFRFQVAHHNLEFDFTTRR